MKYLYKLIVLEWERARLIVVAIVGLLTFGLTVHYGMEWYRFANYLKQNGSIDYFADPKGLFYALIQMFVLLSITLMSGWTWVREWQTRSHFIDRLMLLPGNRFYILIAKWLFLLAVILLLVSVQHVVGLVYYLLVKAFFPVLANTIYFSPSRVLNQGGYPFGWFVPSNGVTLLQYILLMSGVTLTIMNTVLIYRSLINRHRLIGLSVSFLFLLIVPILVFGLTFYGMPYVGAWRFVVVASLGNISLLALGRQIIQHYLSV